MNVEIMTSNARNLFNVATTHTRGSTPVQFLRVDLNGNKFIVPVDTRVSDFLEMFKKKVSFKDHEVYVNDHLCAPTTLFSDCLTPPFDQLVWLEVYKKTNICSVKGCYDTVPNTSSDRMCDIHTYGPDTDDDRHTCNWCYNPYCEGLCTFGGLW